MKTVRLFFCFFVFSALTISLWTLSFNPRVKTGLNISQHYGIEYGYEQYQVTKGIRWGTTSGIAFDFPVNEVLTVSQEFLYTNKGSRQKITVRDQPISLDVFYQTEYLEFPTMLLLNYYRRNNFALYYQTGFTLSFLIYGRYELDGIVETGNQNHEIAVDKKMENIDQFDFGIILGGGVNFSLKNRRFSLDYRINFGIPFIEFPTTEDVLDEEEATRVKLRNQSYSISLGLFF